MSKPLIAGNWKMHLRLDQSQSLAEKVETCAAEYAEAVEVAVFPSMHALVRVEPQLEYAQLGAQNVYYADEGAYTGEVSATQAAELAGYAIVGHSERRYIFGENNETIARKTSACIRNGLSPLVCIGETQHEREEGETTQVINDQIATGLTMLTTDDVANITIAYEPVWAIGTGNYARPEDVESAIKTLRHAIRETFGQAAADSVRVLYGGSVNADTAGSYLDLDTVNGLLVGGASLREDEFNAIIKRAADGE